MRAGIRMEIRPRDRAIAHARSWRRPLQLSEGPRLIRPILSLVSSPKLPRVGRSDSPHADVFAFIAPPKMFLISYRLVAECHGRGLSVLRNREP